jgi:hypothetical protein
MAYYSSGTNLGGRLTIYGPDDYEAGTAESREQAERWAAILDEREDEIREALEQDDTETAERIWAEVESAARAAA